MLQRYEKGGEKGASVRALAPDFFPALVPFFILAPFPGLCRFFSRSALLGLCPFPATRSATRSATCSAARLAAYPAARSAVRFALALAGFFASVNSSAACPAPPRPLRPALLSHQLFRGLLPRTFRALPNLLCPHLLRRPSSLPSSLRPVPFPLPPPLRPSLSLCLPPPVRPASFPRPTTFLPCCCANLCALPGVPLLRVPAPLPRPVVRAPFGRGAP